MAVQLIGQSRAFGQVLEAIALVAPVDSAVLLSGETGTGKALIARAIHEGGPRGHQRFVAVNCAAIPSGLLESELFGHDRGAFTGAISRTIGRFQSADRGTLFLDEIGDLPLELQPKLLRVLREQQVGRLGSGGRPVPVDVRIIAATNQDLREMVERRAFRADLYYRLNVFPILVRPLRERLGDIPLVAAHVVQWFAGNVRELQNVIERAVIATRGAVLHGAAARPGLSRTTLIARMQRLGIARGGARSAHHRVDGRGRAGKATGEAPARARGGYASDSGAPA